MTNSLGTLRKCRLVKAAFRGSSLFPIHFTSLSHSIQFPKEVHHV